MRMFVSIELPEKIQANIHSLIERMKNHLTPVKWVEKKNLHVTLKFLGWVKDDKIQSVAEGVRKSVKGVKPFDIRFKGMGVFPNRKWPKVIWAGIGEGSSAAAALAERLEREAGKEEKTEEEREFTPHLTIGMVKEEIDVDALVKCVDGNKDSDFGGFRVDHVSLMKSTLTRSGPIYEELEQIKFK